MSIFEVNVWGLSRVHSQEDQVLERCLGGQGLFQKVLPYPHLHHLEDTVTLAGLGVMCQLPWHLHRPLPTALRPLRGSLEDGSRDKWEVPKGGRHPDRLLGAGGLGCSHGPSGLAICPQPPLHSQVPFLNYSVHHLKP